MKEKVYIDRGFGFPVEILNAPMRKVRGEWVLDINLDEYEKKLLLALSSKRGRLTGSELKFIRHYFQMTLTAFGKRFGDVAHSAVIKWEKAQGNATRMNWGIEKDIRLHIVQSLAPKSFEGLYTDLEKAYPFEEVPVRICYKV